MMHLPQLNAFYIAMNPWARSLLLNIARRYAARWPAPRELPLLVLVPKPLIIKQAAEGVDDLIHRDPTIITGESVHR